MRPRAQAASLYNNRSDRYAHRHDPRRTRCLPRRAVEMVEALTIVLGVGTVRGWRSVLTWRSAAAVVPLCSPRFGPALQDPDRRPAPARRRPPARLRAAVAAQGDPALERLQAAARRGRGIPARAGAGRGRRRRAAGRARLVLLHRVVQGRPARRTGGRLHRDQLRKRARPARRRDRRRGRGAGGGRRGRRAGARPAAAGSGEHDQVRCRPAAEELRLLLGRRGRRRGVAATSSRCSPWSPSWAASRGWRCAH